MKRTNILGVILALGITAALLSACAPPSLITPAQQTAVAATGMAAANGLLTPNVGTQAPATVTPAPSVTSSASSGVPVTGGTAPAITSTASSGTSNNTNGATGATGSNNSSGSSNGSNNSSGTSSSNGSNGSTGTNGTSGNVPNTGATSAAPTASLGTSGCQSLLAVGSAGPIATLWINNNTGSAMNITMGIPTANSLGQCGFLTFGPIGPGKTLRVRVPVTQTSLGDSCYWAFATPVNTQGRQSVVNGDNAGYCITTPKRWVMNIRSDRIRLAAP